MGIFASNLLPLETHSPRTFSLSDDQFLGKSIKAGSADSLNEQK